MRPIFPHEAMTGTVFLAAAAAVAAGCFFCFARHSYLTRGPRMTFNFFFFATLYVARWTFKNPGGTPPFPGGQALLSARQTAAGMGAAAGCVAILGWVCLIYAGWFIASKLIGGRRPARLFPLLLAGCLASVCLLYPFEAAGIAMGWWRWHALPSPLDRLFIGVPFHALREAFFFVLYFLAAYFLIECSRFRDKDWKAVFFALPFIHFWTVRYGGGGVARAAERITAFAAILFLACFSALEFREGTPSRGTRSASDRPVLAGMLLAFSLAASVDLFVARSPGLLLSLVPALCVCAFPVAGAFGMNAKRRRA